MGPADKTFSDALEAGLELLSTRDRSESQLRSALGAAEFQETIIDEVIARLKTRNILNDARFAGSLVRKRIQKGIGLDRIRQELVQMGLDEAVIESVASSLSGDQPQLAMEALRKRLAKSPALTRPGAYRFLAGKGFSESDIEHAVDALLGATDPFAE